MCIRDSYYTGSIGRHEVVLVESGIGKVMSAMSVAVLANDFKAVSYTHLDVYKRQLLLLN